MDEVKIQTNFIKSILSRIVKNLIHKKLGVWCDLDIKQLHLENNGEKTKLTVELDAKIATSDFVPILQKFKMY